MMISVALSAAVSPSIVGFVAVSAGAAGVLWATAATRGAAAFVAHRLANNPPLNPRT